MGPRARFARAEDFQSYWELSYGKRGLAMEEVPQVRREFDDLMDSSLPLTVVIERNWDGRWEMDLMLTAAFVHRSFIEEVAHDEVPYIRPKITSAIDQGRNPFL